MWIRDAAFTVYALMRIGFTEEAGHFMDWLAKRCRELGDGGTLQIMYDIGGQPDDREETVLGHLDGYRGSRPVRIGNGAVQQLQLDIYGELMDSVYLYDKYGTPDQRRPLAAPAPAHQLGVRPLDATPTRASGRCAAGAATSSTRS